MIAPALSTRDWLVERIRTAKARVAVIGMGRVGLPFAVDAAKAGLHVTGIDRDAVRVAQLSQGSNYLRNVDDRDVIAVVSDERLHVTANMDAISECDVIVVCIPSPLDHAKTPDFGPVREVCEEITRRLRPGQLVVLENGTYPGLTNEVLLPALTASPLTLGHDYFVAIAPERADPGNARFRTGNTARIVAGVTAECGTVAGAFYELFSTSVIVIADPRVAELCKVFENTFRAVNIALVNELAMLCDRLGINVWDVIDAANTKPFGMMRFDPGPGVGGSGVPDDAHYLSWVARKHHASAHLLDAAGDVNAAMPTFVRDKVARALNGSGKAVRGSTVLLIGVAYKRNVADTFASPGLQLATALERDGARVVYHDPLLPSVAWPDGKRRVSVPLDNDTLSSADCAVIVTDHDGIDWEHVVRSSQLVVDTRNATRSVDAGRERIVLL
ncbi:MAG: nucleotide sugar dehydrogenase [Candidatus Lustribacter sp.]|jgi:UDP-N-acetyl-D-glucosamine dehydrogenase